MRVNIAIYIPEDEEIGREPDLIQLEGVGISAVAAVKDAINNYKGVNTLKERVE